MIKHELNETQRVLLTMLQWFHQYCVNNELRYYIIGGTMLGAARHNGFIPWDDDIDIGMPRKDYDLLIKQSLMQSHDQYTIEYPNDSNKDFPYIFAKVYDKKTTLIERLRVPVKRGVYLDIFPLDGIGDTLDEALRNYKKIHIFNRMHDMIVCQYRTDRDWYKNLSIVLGRIISPLFISERRINHIIQSMCKTHDFDKSIYVGNLLGNWGVKEIMSKDLFGEPTLYKFENIEVYGPQNYDGYLTRVYKNWRQLPPIEKRKSHHDYSYLDLNHSYLCE